jgi:flagellar biosynthetic protein FliP
MNVTQSSRRAIVIALVTILTFVFASSSFAQSTTTAESSQINPIAVLEDAARLLPTGDSASVEGSVSAEGKPLSTALNIVFLLTVLTLAPAVLVLCTCFTRIVIVLSLLRQALGTQAVPPSQVIVGLSLFITAVVMAPTAERMYKDGVGPYVRGEETDYRIAWEKTRQPLREFMFAQLEATGNWSGLYMSPMACSARMSTCSRSCPRTS